MAHLRNHRCAKIVISATFWLHLEKGKDEAEVTFLSVAISLISRGGQNDFLSVPLGLISTSSLASSFEPPHFIHPLIC